MYLLRLVFLVGFLLLYFLFLPQKVFAVTVSILNEPSSITQDAFIVTASVSGAQTGTNYLRIDLYKDGTTNYFGDTYNGSSWYNGSDGTQYFPITIPLTSSVQIQGRFGSPTGTQYDGTGVYKLRIRRYTQSGNSGSNDTMDTVRAAIAIPTATPTPNPIDTPTPTPKIPTAISKPLPTAASVVRPSITSAVATFGAVLGSSSAFQTTPTEIPTKVLAASASKPSILVPILFIIAGFCLLGSCGILVFFQYKKEGKLW